MLKRIEKNSDCKFAEQAASYLYGETTAPEKVKFETHLQSCSQCAEDLAGFGIIRSAMLDWKGEIFTELETPIFDVHQIKSPGLTHQPEKANSWFDNFRKLIQFNPAFAGLAVLVICAGIVYFALTFTTENGLVARKSEQALIEPEISPTNEITKNNREIIPSQPNNLAVRKTETAETLPNTKSDRQIESRTEVVKTSVKAANTPAKPLRPVRETFEKPRTTSTVKKPPIPELEDTDYEDKSVRLADLFDEIGAK